MNVGDVVFCSNGSIPEPAAMGCFFGRQEMPGAQCLGHRVLATTTLPAFAEMPKTPCVRLDGVGTYAERYFRGTPYPEASTTVYAGDIAFCKKRGAAIFCRVWPCPGHRVIRVHYPETKGECLVVEHNDGSCSSHYTWRFNMTPGLPPGALESRHTVRATEAVP